MQAGDRIPAVTLMQMTKDGPTEKRYSMLVDDGVVTDVFVEETPGTAEVSGAAALLG